MYRKQQNESLIKKLQTNKKCPTDTIKTLAIVIIYRLKVREAMFTIFILFRCFLLLVESEAPQRMS